MIINHNVNALTALNKFSAAGKEKASSVEKLCSGMRINKAADDAAGATIDEKMRAQINGLEQAGTNIQDGISLIQTAEAGLGSIQNPNLFRMRDLIVQALNGTLSQDDRMKIQNELDQVKESINDTAKSTNFNTISLLTPPTSSNVVPPKWTPGTADIVFIIDRTGSMGTPISKVKNNLDGFINKLTENGIDVNMGLVTYGDVNPSQGGDAVLKSPMTKDLDNLKSYIDNIVPSGGGDTNESGLEGIADSGNGALSYNLRSDSAKQFILVTDAPVHDATADGGDGESSLNMSNVINELKSNGVKFTVVGPTSGDAETQLNRLSSATGGDYLNIYDDFGNQLDSFASKVLIDAGCNKEIDDSEMGTLQLQVGAKSNEQFLVELFDARTKNLGIDNVNVDTNEEALISLDEIDKAIDITSAQRSKFGAYQNTLNHIYNNVRNYGYNLTLADSTVKDVDMAKEVMKMTKSNILQEASQAMLKQSENIGESISNLMDKWQVNSTGK
ncbi:flagellin N-terminal helical domain-containing protein [Clostridium hydrogenum]|uniref:flagellin N-terminal helical domain-containing protein n=1 Tax=Clostridium hydrogenum TaxID=2855764 RepID=UPI001F1FC50E|nr:flagellin [Clostridium hydrogenum]